MHNGHHCHKRKLRLHCRPFYNSRLQGNSARLFSCHFSRPRAIFIATIAALTVKMNVSEFTGDNATLERSDVNYTVLRQQDTYWATIITFRHVIWYVALALGIPGSILSAIVWLRHHVANNSSSSIYLSALAIANFVYLISRFLCLDIILSYAHVLDGWIWYGANYVAGSAGIFQPLLLLGFSAERLISVLRPLKVCHMRFSCTLFI